jgi:sister-chromatid-cohesion protein PDS5
LRRLKAPPSPGSQQFWYYYNILEVAASIKVFSLCHNYGFDQIGKQVIMTCIKTVSVVKNKPKAISSMVKIIEQYLSCAETISRELLDLVLMPLLDKVKEPAAYELCKELWMAASGDLEPFLQSLYSSSLGGGIGTDEEKEPCLAIQHINDIILELHRIAPTVLNTILPQMEYRLKVEEEEVRCETAQLLGRMFAEQSSLLAQENKALWQSFCGR